MCDTRYSVNDNPESKPGNVHPYKGHTAAESGNRIRDEFGSGPVHLCSFLQRKDRLNIFGDMRHSSRRSKKTACLMAYNLIWSPAARDDLHDIVVFIARDNPNRAMSFGYELISETNRLQEFQSWVASFPNTMFVRSFFDPMNRVPSHSRREALRDCTRLAFRARNSRTVNRDIRGK